MTRLEPTLKSASIPPPIGNLGPRRLARAASLFNRPVTLGLLALLAILGSCQTYGSSLPPSYDEGRYNETTPSQPAGQRQETDAASAAESNALPLLFLTFVGLAGMALSRTRSSGDDRH